MREIKKILLTIPNNRWTGRRTQWTSFPYTLAVLTSVLKDKYEIKISHYCVFNIANPLPKTQLYNIAKEKGLLRPDFSFDDFRGYGYPSIITKEFTPSELLMFRVMEWDRINFKTPEKIRRIAERNGMTVEEVQQWRIDTRRGVNVELKKLETEKDEN